MKILMVCLGNICRSTLAEGILDTKAKANGLDWFVDSAGTGNWHVGDAPDSRSIAVGKKYGVDISEQKARQIRAKDLEEFDLIFAMDSSNYSNILHLTKDEKQAEKVHLIRNMVNEGQNLAVPDPYYGTSADFEKVFAILDEACDKIVETYGT